MKHVLIIAYHFPPISNIGSLRPYRWVQHLGEFGWDATVLTVGNDTYYQRDPSFKTSDLKDIRVLYANRLPIYKLTKRFFRRIFGKKQLLYSFLDTYYDWYPMAKMVGKREVAVRKYDAILATSPPYTSLRIARAIARASGLPCIADLRDPFTQNPYIEMPSEVHRRFYYEYERKLLDSFDLITVAWPKIAEWDSNSLRIDSRKFLVVTNGYEPADFENRFERPTPTDIFTLGYFGSIYGLRTVDPLFKGYGIAVQRSPEFRKGSQVVFSGAFDRLMIRKTAIRTGCERNLRILEFHPRYETLDWMSKCNVLVLLTGMVAENYPGKLFDYMASNRPILNLSKPSSLTRLIEDTGIGVNVDASTPEKVADILLEWFGRFREGKELLHSDPAKIKQFDGRVLAGRMASALDAIV